MCKMTQNSVLFTHCQHLSVVCTIKACFETPVPGGPPHYCGPAEMTFATVAELQILDFRCKNCRSPSNEVTLTKTGSFKTIKGNQIDDLISFSSPSEQQNQIEQRQVVKERCQVKQSKERRKEKQSKEIVVKDQQVEDASLIKEEEQPETKDDDEPLKKKGTKCGVPIAEWGKNEKIMLQIKADAARKLEEESKRPNSIWDEELSSSEMSNTEDKAAEPNT